MARTVIIRTAGMARHEPTGPVPVVTLQIGGALAVLDLDGLAALRGRLDAAQGDAEADVAKAKAAH